MLVNSKMKGRFCQGSTGSFVVVFLFFGFGMKGQPPITKQYVLFSSDWLIAKSQQYFVMVIHVCCYVLNVELFARQYAI